MTGYADLVDPVEHTTEISRHRPGRVISLTDPADRVVDAQFQNAFAEVLNSAGVDVEQRMLSAADPDHHNLRYAALLAGLASAAA